MAPKRKRVEPDGGQTSVPASTTRTTRSSVARLLSEDGSAIGELSSNAATTTNKTATKITSSAASRTAKIASPGNDAVAEDNGEDEPLAKKTKGRSTQPKAKALPKTRTSRGKDSKESILVNDEPEKTRSKLSNGDNAAESSKSTSLAAPVPEPYTPTGAVALFSEYVDADNTGVIGPEGFERLCSEAAIPLDGARPLVLAWLLEAKEMGRITREEWTKGMEELRISSLPTLSLALQEFEDLLIRGQPAVPSSQGSATAKRRAHHAVSEPYHRARYHEYAKNRKGAFSKLYTYCFALAKPPQTRNIDMETATAFWSVLLVPQYTIMAEVIEFINEKGSYKGANKDLWSMVFEFCQSVKPNLENYETDGAWPTLLDDFVEWKKAKTLTTNGDPSASVAAENS